MFLYGTYLRIQMYPSQQNKWNLKKHRHQDVLFTPKLKLCEKPDFPIVHNLLCVFTTGVKFKLVRDR